MRKELIATGLLIILVAGVWILTLYKGPALPESQGFLSPSEVHGYEGIPLGTAMDFRENSISGPREIDPENYHLAVTGLVHHSLNQTYPDILAMYPSYRKVVTIYCVEGWDVTILWEGILVSDILRAADVRPEANTVIFHADDGYSTSVPLPYLTENQIMMAYRMNNETLPKDRGFPFQLVAEDKWGYKWIKWITGIEVTDDPSYEGYWESRGYSLDGDVSRPFFD